MVRIRLLRNTNPRYISTARGKYLDIHAKMFGLERKTYFWVFKESDKKLRERIRKFVIDYSRHQIKTIHEEIREEERRFRGHD